MMKVLAAVTFLGLLAVVPACAGASERATGGLAGAGRRSGDANPFQFPWQAALLTTADQFFCGASVIGLRWLLTAGHCLDPFDELHVAVGGLSLPDGSHQHYRQTFSTRDMHQHPQFDMEYLDNDIGLVGLPADLKMTMFVKPVRLPSYSMATEDLSGKTVSISGWGKAGEDPSPSPVLRYTELEILPDSECENVYGNTMLGNKMCLSAEEGNSVCQGDSGGALVIRKDGDNLGGDKGDFIQIGITSFISVEGCTVKLPQGFTKVASFLEFIEEITNIPIDD